MIIGHITGSLPSTPYEFHFRLHSEFGKDPKFVPQIEDVVSVEFEYGGYGKVKAYGMVVEIESRWDGEPMMGFEETLAIEKRIKKVLKTFVAKVVVTRMVAEGGKPVEVPPPPGTPVKFVDSQEEVDTALGFDEIKKRNRALPVGVMKNGKVAYLDMDYVLGENGAHINISGQSGVAAKTSYMTFLMKSLMKMVEKAIFIVFNVKGQSLMFIDRVSLRWERMVDGVGKDHERLYEVLGIDSKPFENVNFYAIRKSTINDRPDSLRHSAMSYWWTTDDIFDLDLFEMIFDPEELYRNNNLMLAVMLVNDYMNPESESERRRRRNLIKNPTDLVKQLDEDSDLVDFLREQEGLHKATVKLLKRRLSLAIQEGLDKLWGQRFDDENRVNWKRPGSINVIDISKLRTRMQAFVVGAVLKDIMKTKEEGELIDVPVFILVDELNKYAPRHERSEITSIFRDVAERGRSFKVILISAEQTASEVDYRVITQSATVVVGRQKWVELQKSEYGHLLPEQKIKASALKQGEVIVDQPFLRVPLTVRFPFPVWALREDDYSNDVESGLDPLSFGS